MWCSGARVSLCSPSGRASSANSTCKVSHSCLLVDWVLSGSNGGEPSITLPAMPRTLQANRPPQIPHFLHVSPSPTSKRRSPSTFSFQFRRSPTPLHRRRVETVPAWSVAQWPLRSSWQACTGVRAHLPEIAYTETQQCMWNPFFLWSVRSRMGPLGDPPAEPHHRHLCPLRPAGKHCPVSINPVQRPGCRLTGIIPGKIKTDGQLRESLHVIQTTEALTDPFIIVLKCICWNEFGNNRRFSCVCCCAETAARESFIFSPPAKPNTPWQVWARMPPGVGQLGVIRFILRDDRTNEKCSLCITIEPTCDLASEALTTTPPPHSPTVASRPPWRWCRSCTWTKSAPSPWPLCSCPAAAAVDAATRSRSAWSNVRSTLLSMQQQQQQQKHLTSICWFFLDYNVNLLALLLFFIFLYMYKQNVCASIDGINPKKENPRLLNWLN